MKSIYLITAGILATLPLAAHAMPVIGPPSLDPQLFVGAPGSTTPPGGTAIGHESNLLTGTGPISMTFGVAGTHVMQGPTLVIFALAGPGSVTLTSSSCMGLGNTCALAAAGTYGLTLGSETLGSGQKTYAQLGLADGGSESYANYALTSPLQVPPLPVPTLYSLEVFAIPAALSTGVTIDATETGAANGSYVMLYSCETKSLPAGAVCDKSGQIGATPFTNAGLIDGNTTPPPPPPPVPEPGTLALLGVGLFGLAAVTKRQTSRRS
jgi:hypothetical protein